jgi:uncharacterized protein YjbI with pentapeptide repeats
MPSELPALPDQEPQLERRDPVPWWWVWSAIGGGITAGGIVTAALWLTRATTHKDALDVGMKVALATVGLLGVLLAVHRYKLSERVHELAEAEHRRQLKVDEANQKHADALLQRQIAADQAAREDAIARQITDLSSKASEQLGSDKAAVRIGGLTDLERLAQAYPDLRQTVVDRICAYLRTPVGRPLQQTMDGLGQDFMEQAEIARSIEFDVRRTAQMILTRHLYWPQDTDRPRTFWDNILIDLRNAELSEFMMRYSRVTSAQFDNAKFFDHADFLGSTFDVICSFDGAIFNKGALFRSAALRDASFEKTSFKGFAIFTKSSFEDNADFSHAVFDLGASFEESHFKGTIHFDSAVFRGRASFRSASFGGESDFTRSVFHGAADFEFARFSSVSRVERAEVIGSSSRKWPKGWRVENDPDSPSRGFVVVDDQPTTDTT